jgi:hypothetical protein
VGTNLEGWYVDDIAIKNQALVEIQSNLFNATNIRVGISDTFTIIIPAPACVAASITSQPSNATVCAGNSTTFNTTATGTTPSYQWQVSTDGGLSFVNISGANIASYTLTNITTAEHNNQYRVITSNACPSSSTSAAAILTVNTPPSITTQPVSQVICEGGSTSFSISVNGTATLYQWQVSTDGGLNFTNVSGANSTSYTLTNITAAQHNNQYRVVVSNVCPPSTTSAAAILAVNIPASITNQPVNQVVCEGENASFSISANGTANFYQWQESTDGGATFTNIIGETNPTLFLNNITASLNNHQYHVMITSCGTGIRCKFR